MITEFVTNHLLATCFLLFMSGLIVSSVCGVSPFTKSNEANKQAVDGRPARNAISKISLMVAVIGEWAFFIGAILSGVRLIV
jgi:hypothetical protein